MKPFVFALKMLGLKLIASSIGERSRLILASTGQVVSTTFDAGKRSRELALRSVSRKFGSLPVGADNFESFETSDGRVRAERAISSEFDAWCLRYSEPDKDTSGRDWIVEMSSLTNEDQSQFSCRLSCYTSDQNFSFMPATPGALKEVVSAMSYHSSGFVLTPEVQEVGVGISLDDLVKQLRRSDRWWNCLVVAESFTKTYGLDPRTIHQNVMGCANTFLLPTEIEPEFSKIVGQEFTVFGGGARSFRPGFDTLSSEMTAHPVIKAPYVNNSYAVGRAHHILSSDAFRSSVDRPNLRTLVPSFATIRQLSTKLRSDTARQTGNSSDTIIALENQLIAEQKNSTESFELAIQADEERQSAHEALENEQAISFGLKRRVETLEAKLRETNATVQTAAPNSYDEIKDWVAENFAGKLRLLPRAEKGLKAPKYEKLEDVVSGLELLAGTYRLLKMGKCIPETFVEECTERGFEESKSISRTSAGKQGEEYFVRYSGERTFLDRHLTKGNVKDARFCLRIYYFWDEVSEIVVVGSLPEHLKTGAT